MKKFGRILAIVQQDDRLMIKIQCILLLEELPRNLQSANRIERSQEGKVWFLDREEDNAIVMIEPNMIVKHITVTILYDDNATNCNTIKI